MLKNIIEKQQTYYSIVGFMAVCFVSLGIWIYFLTRECYENLNVGLVIEIFFGILAFITAGGVCTLIGLCGPDPDGRLIFLFCASLIAIECVCFCGVLTSMAQSCTDFPQVPSSPSGDPTTSFTPSPSGKVSSPSSTQEIRNDDLSLSPTVAALSAFYDEANGFNWNTDTNWKTDMDVCDWYGIVCNDNRSIVGLYLNDNNLYGSISTSIGLLTDLVDIELESNYMSGPIPTQVGNLSNLRRLELDGNELTGTIPSELFNIKDLKELYLQLNNFSGTVPQELCLRRIDMGGELDTLIADCEGNGNSFGNEDIVCDCCSQCY